MQSCYYPTVVSDTKTDKQSSNCRLDGIRSNADQILPAYMQISVNHAASGSSYVELHGTKVVCSVYGPRNDPRSQKEFQEKGKFLCDVRFAPFCSAPTRPQRGQVLILRTPHQNHPIEFSVLGPARSRALTNAHKSTHTVDRLVQASQMHRLMLCRHPRQRWKRIISINHERFPRSRRCSHRNAGFGHRL